MKMTRTQARAFALAQSAAAPLIRFRKTSAKHTEQRDIFARVGMTAARLQEVLGCKYVRARDLRSGRVPIRSAELVALLHHPDHAVTGRLIADVLSPKDVRRVAAQASLFDAGPEGSGGTPP